MSQPFRRRIAGVLAASTLIVLASRGCSNTAVGTATPTGATRASATYATVSASVKPASTVTERANADQLRHAPFSDTTDFQSAARGLIAPLPNEGVIKDKDGKVVWNLKAYRAFIAQGQKAPDTVNPSLWRMAQLLMFDGLFEVVPGVYQVRGADLSNMTIVEGQRGITIYDPLISKETAKFALDLYYAHRPKKPVVAVIYTHSHTDHFGGIRGVVDEKDVKAGKVKIYAPDGFLEAAVEENVFAGTAMARRASYMYGNLTPPDPMGQVTSGLGIATSTGTVGLIAPTDVIKTTGERRTIDGIVYEFVMAPDSEAPAEMMWFIPSKKLLNTAEDSTHTMHNLYTLRGAKTRDAQKWPRYLNEVLERYGKDVETEIGMHHWPTWGNAAIVAHIKAQRDVYKFMHDQTLHYANQGYTMNELPDLVKLRRSSRACGPCTGTTARRATMCVQSTTTTSASSTATRRTSIRCRRWRSRRNTSPRWAAPRRCSRPGSARSPPATIGGARSS
jgi:alkyl sulfatase BDS1-like metallo-beta-lactamase superfamily hydrolase